MSDLCHGPEERPGRPRMRTALTWEEEEEWPVGGGPVEGTVEEAVGVPARTTPTTDFLVRPDSRLLHTHTHTPHIILHTKSDITHDQKLSYSLIS